MNLLGRTTIGLLFLSALFFFSCDDELNKIGNETGQDKFDLLYKEFILPSKVVLFDSIRTDNTSRLLVGQYEDPTFGSIKSTAYAVYGTTSGGTLEDAVIDSIQLNLKMDYYYYGRTSNDYLELSFNVHQISEKLESTDYHFNYSSTEYDPTPIGNVKFRYITDSLDYYGSISNPDTSYVVSFKLPDEYSLQLASTIKNLDSLYKISDHKFGFALVPESGEDIIGFQTTSTSSNLTVHYHTSNANNLTFPFTLNTTTGYNQIESDRTGTSLELLTSFNSGEELDGNRYIQGISGIFTQVDLKPYFTFTKSLDNILINSAEIVIDPIDDFSNLTPPTKTTLIHSNDEYKFEQLTAGDVAYDYAFNDSFSQFEMSLAIDEDEKNVISGFPTLYFQSLYDNQVEDANLVIVPSGFSTSLNRASFNKDNIKLRVYYTIPKK